MKKLLVFLCSLALIFGLAGNVFAKSYTEKFEGNELFGTGESHEFRFCFWHTDAEDNLYPTGTPFNLDKTMDAEDAYEPWAAMTAWVDVWSVDSELDTPQIVIQAWTSPYYGDPLIEVWSQTLDLSSSGNEYFTFAYKFTDAEVATWESNGWGAITISAVNLPGNDFNILTVGMTLETVPEPGTMLLFGSGLVGLAGLGRRKFFKK
jgi:hypothetical protein